METLKFVIAKNLTKLRKHSKLTQIELAEKMHYSDKAVSKWETGETSPSIDTLKELADFYNIKVDDLLNENFEIEKTVPEYKNGHKHSRTIISLLGILCVWFIGTLIFVTLFIYNPEVKGAWLSFIYCIPATMILAIIFNSIWGPIKANYVYISILTWSIITAIFLSLLVFSDLNLWPLFILGAPSEVIIVLWSRIKKKPRIKS